MKKTKVNYIDNEKFLQELINYSVACEKAKKDKKPDPPIPEYIGECFLKIAQNFAKTASFCNYSYKEEFIGDAVENCLQYFRNFDPNKSKNPFSYFTQIVYFAFIRRIGKEKKQNYIKYKLTEQKGIDNDFEMHDSDEGMNMRQPEMLYENMAEYIQNYEEKVEQKKKKRKKKLPEEN